MAVIRKMVTYMAGDLAENRHKGTFGGGGKLF